MAMTGYQVIMLKKTFESNSDIFLVNYPAFCHYLAV